MNVFVTEIRHSDLGSNNGCGLEFNVNGFAHAEYIDVEDDFNLCTSGESNLYMHAGDEFTGEEINEIHSQLAVWLDNNPVSQEYREAVLEYKEALRSEMHALD